MLLSSPKRQLETLTGVRILFFEQQWHSVQMFAKLRYWYVSEMKCITTVNLQHLDTLKQINSWHG